MTPGSEIYYALFGITAASSLIKYRNSIFIANILIVYIFVAFRHEVSTDWPNYLEILSYAKGVSLPQALGQIDSGYGLLNWIGANRFGGIYFVNAICAIFAVGGLAYFCSRMRNPLLALAVAVPYLVIIIDVSATRQSAAAGLVLVALIAALDQKPYRFVFCIILATLLHKSALFMVLFLPVTGIVGLRLKEIVGIAILLVAVGVYAFGQTLPALIDLYINRGGIAAAQPSVPLAVTVHSSGAVIRALMTAVAAVVLLALMRFDLLRRTEIRVWLLAVGVSIALFVLSFFYSTLADRLGIYLVAVQLMAFSCAPLVLPSTYRFFAKLVILAGYGCTMWVWLNFGDNAKNWIPYHSILPFLK